MIELHDYDDDDYDDEGVNFDQAEIFDEEYTSRRSNVMIEIVQSTSSLDTNPEIKEKSSE